MNILLLFPIFVKKKSGSGSCRGCLLLAEGHAVGALVLGGVCLMGANQDPVQGAVVLAVAVMGALGYGALNGLIRIAVHGNSSFFGFGLIIPRKRRTMLEKCGNPAD